LNLYFTRIVGPAGYIRIQECSRLISLNLRPINSRQSDTVSDIGVSRTYTASYIHTHTHTHYTRANTSESRGKVQRGGFKGEFSHTHPCSKSASSVHTYTYSRISTRPVGNLSSVNCARFSQKKYYMQYDGRRRGGCSRDL